MPLRDDEMDTRGDEYRRPSPPGTPDYPQDSSGNTDATPAMDDKEPPTNLYVRGVAPQATDEEMSSAFKKFGQVVSCSVVRDPYTRECRGFAFVKFASSVAATEAMNSEGGIEVCGRRLIVERARRNGPHEKTPGQYLGVDKSVRERYSGYKRIFEGRRRDPSGGYFDDRRHVRGRPDRFERHDKWRVGDSYEHERNVRRRRFSPDRGPRRDEYYRNSPIRDLDAPRDRRDNTDRGGYRGFKAARRGSPTRQPTAGESVRGGSRAWDDYGRDRR